MKRFAYLFYCILIFATSFSQTINTSINIIPEPVLVAIGKDFFTLPNTILIAASDNTDLKPIIETLKLKLSVPTGAKVLSITASNSSTISLTLNTAFDNLLGKEGYKLSVTPKGISLKANAAAGLFYGIQSLLQLLPKEIESKTIVKNIKWEIPSVEITDYPRFVWRGLMFDVSRHFFTKKEVEQYIDAMVKYKYNILHLHLTDDEGWRIEIKSLPKLTEKGAWNVKKVGYFGSFSDPQPEEPRNYGGFFTQEDIKDIVKYAKERYLNILPEIDVPGHSLAAIVAYPELSCTPGADKYKVRSGEKIMDWHGDGKFIALVDNTLCPANENVYQFLDKVITELAVLFPFEYIHMGGDECAKNFWEKSEAVKSLMKNENLKSMEEVQSYFEKRIEKIVKSKGKKFMGWDEILEGGLGPDASVMSWRGMKGGKEAAKMGHDVVMSPTTYGYLDFMQGDPIVESKVYESLRLNKAYSFEPVPDSVDAKYIKGGQANLWTEQIYNIRYAEYMTWPRAMAIAETVWSPKQKKNWNNFSDKVQNHFKRFDIAETKYAPSIYEPIFSVSQSADKQLKIDLTTEINGLDIYYSFDNSFPDNFYPKYTQSLIPPKDAVMLKVVTYKGKHQVGRMMTVTLEELQKRINKK